MPPSENFTENLNNDIKKSTGNKHNNLYTK